MMAPGESTFCCHSAKRYFFRTFSQIVCPTFNNITKNDDFIRNYLKKGFVVW